MSNEVEKIFENLKDEVISIELYKGAHGEKCVSISTENSSGAEYEINESQDIGTALTTYLLTYYSD